VARLHNTWTAAMPRVTPHYAGAGRLCRCWVLWPSSLPLGQQGLAQLAAAQLLLAAARLGGVQQG
jgi:hypothetical protein